mgnify:CR=1 FL=1|tara:strand:+ start:4 stop:1260 length:1257 start_codon:yes stop_codon:yes gene_type:complete
MKDLNLKIAIAGNVDSGKSTLAGVLLNNCLDDGKGLCRRMILKNKHEQETGRTSTITNNSYVNIKDNNRIITSLIDLAGHEKYLKTTMTGITGSFVDYGLVLVGANMGVTKMTKEHIALLLFLNIPIIILITKIDMSPEEIKQVTVKRIKKLISLPAFNKKAFHFNENESTCKKEVEEIRKISNFYDTYIPIINVSNKSGQNIDNLKELILDLKPRYPWKEEVKGSIMYIDSKFNVKGIGIVLSGTLRGSSVKINDKLNLGPIDNKFIPVKVRSIHNNVRENINELNDNEVGCLAIRFVGKDILTRDQIKRGVVLLSDDNLVKNVRRKFKANITILNHSTTISDSYQPVIHCGMVRQSAKVKILSKNDDNSTSLKLRTGDKATVEFKFVYSSEYIEKGTTFFFRDGTTKGYGSILELL